MEPLVGLDRLQRQLWGRGPEGGAGVRRAGVGAQGRGLSGGAGAGGDLQQPGLSSVGRLDRLDCLHCQASNNYLCR